MASLAKDFTYHQALVSADTCATVSACETIGATINPSAMRFSSTRCKESRKGLRMLSIARTPGTTLRFLMGVCSLIDGTTVFDRDASLRTRRSLSLSTLSMELEQRFSRRSWNGTRAYDRPSVFFRRKVNAYESDEPSVFIIAFLISLSICVRQIVC